MTRSDSPSPVRKIARITGKPGRDHEILEALAHLERQTQAEPGCLEFRFFQSITRATDFVLLEQFASASALQEHLQMPYTKAFFAAQLVESVQAIDVPALS